LSSIESEILKNLIKELPITEAAEGGGLVNIKTIEQK